MSLTNEQKTLIQLLKYYKFDTNAILAIMGMLNLKSQESELLQWMQENQKASQFKILMQAIDMTGVGDIRNELEDVE